MKSEKKLFLLDAFALIYRAYFAFTKNPRINSKGLDTSAVFGFTNTLIEVLNKEQPTHIAVVFDRSTPTQRHIEYPEYKAHREAMPEGIKKALPYIDRLLKAFNIPKIYKDGYEADDVIGTLAKKAEIKGYKIYMMTSDKDFAQLVSDNIFMYRPGNRFQPTTIWGVPEVLEKFDIDRIDQVIDFLGMMGDTADNIPGIPGIGKKTAQKFLKQYGSMEGLFDNSHQLKGKIREKVEVSKEIGLLCKKLVTIITDVPVLFNEEELTLESKNELEVKELFEELEFRTLLTRVLNSHSGNQKTSKKEINFKKVLDEGSQFNLFSELVEPQIPKEIKRKYELLSDKKKIKSIIKKIEGEKEFSFQIITSSEDVLNTKLAGISLSFTNTNGFYIPYNFDFLALIKLLFENENILKISYNLKFAIKVLIQNNINIKGKMFDVQIAHYLLHPEMRRNLDVIAEDYLKIKMLDKKLILGKGKLKVNFSEIKEELITEFASEKSSVNFILAKHLRSEMIEAGVYELFNDIEIPLISVLAKMEIEGVGLDIEALKNYSNKLTKELFKITQNIYEQAEVEFNITSPKQMGEILFDKMGLSKKPKKTKSGQYSTSEETLLKLKHVHPIIDSILTFRGIKKLLSTYVDALPDLVNKKTKRIHTTFNQAVTSTGRLSSMNPNIQNIPIRTTRGMMVRKAFVARDKNYTLMAADYSQIELRIMASLSQDDGMLSAFNNGLDIHAATASKVFKVGIADVDKSMRSQAKSVNFGIIYGISAFGLSQNIGVSRTEAKQIIDEYFEQFPKVKEYMSWSIEQAREKEFVETIMGRRRYLKDINTRNGVLRAMAERNAINAPIQGSAADIIKIAMIEIDKEIEQRKMQSKMLLQVHDELVFDMHNSEEKELIGLVKEKMEHAITLKVPLLVDIGIGENWLEAH